MNQTYDDNGNLTKNGNHTFVYDAESHMTSANVGGSDVSLLYDPLGRLYEVSGAYGVTRFLYDGGDLVAEYDGSGALLRRYVHGDGAGDDPQVWFEGSSVADSARHYLYADARGSTVAIADSSGNIKQTNSYDEYGIPSDDGNDIATRGRFRYTGQAWIPELGMYYYKARMYSPTLGRFMQPDPIGYGDGMNVYTYVANDPINKVDPTGLACADVPPDGNGVIVVCADRGAFWKAFAAALADYLDRANTITVTARRRNGNGSPQNDKKLPPCAQKFLAGRISGDPGAITFHDGGSVFNRFDNSVTYGSDIYLADGMIGRSDRNALIHKFHEIQHTSQNARLGLSTFDHAAAYVVFGGHDASPYEQAADDFGADAYKAYKAAGLDKTCPF